MYLKTLCNLISIVTVTTIVVRDGDGSKRHIWLKLSNFELSCRKPVTLFGQVCHNINNQSWSLPCRNVQPPPSNGSSPKVHIVCGANIEFTVGCDCICTLWLPWSEGHHVEWHSCRSCSMSAYCCFDLLSGVDGDDDSGFPIKIGEWPLALSPQNSTSFFR